MVQQRLIHPIVKYKTDKDLVKYVAPNGSASLVKHFFQKSGITPSFKHHIDQIKITSNNHIEISTQNGEKDLFQAAILTMPIPQIINLPGMGSILSSEVSEKLSNVQYHSRYALGLFYEEQFLNENFIPEVEGYKKLNNSIFSYVSHDPRVRIKSNVDKYLRKIIKLSIFEILDQIQCPYSKLAEELLPPLPQTLNCVIGSVALL